MKSLKERLEKTEVEEPVYIPTADGQAVAETVYVKVPAWRDPVDGEIYLDDEAQAILDKVKARRMGLLMPAELKGFRRKHGLTQAQTARLLQMGEKTWTRWESGRERPSRSMNLLLRALCDGKLDLVYLDSLQSTPDAALRAGLLRQQMEMAQAARRDSPLQRLKAALFQTQSASWPGCAGTGLPPGLAGTSFPAAAGMLAHAGRKLATLPPLAEFARYGGRIAPTIPHQLADEEVTT